MVRSFLLGTLFLGLAFAGPAASACTHTRHHRHTARQPGSVMRNGLYGGYSSPVSPTTTCRYADGTPYDPDVIGGPNHVGAGGPAVNLGGFDPCAF